MNAVDANILVYSIDTKVPVKQPRPRVGESGVVLMQTITATFEDGVLKPTQPLNLPEHMQVRLTLEPLEREPTDDERLAAFDDLMRIAKPHPGPHMTRDELHERH
jgi:predicted DNA-binding antitoxin AbrB/MazE fold protein